MASTVHAPYSNEQITAWLRGLLAIAWADGHFDPEEKELIASLTHSELAIEQDLGDLEPITPDELAAAFKDDERAAENFLRTAVMLAVADGAYSLCEDEILRQFCEALGQAVDVLDALQPTLYDTENEQAHSSTDSAVESVTSPGGAVTGIAKPPSHHRPDLLHPVKDWLDELDVHDPRLAKFLCKLIPSQCPFERDVNLFGRKVLHIPPLCKLNPLYEQLVSLRFKALSYLADDCGEDVTPYC